MTDRLDLFTTPVLTAQHPEADALNAALLSAISAERARSSGVTKSNLGGWHSEATMQDWGGEAAQALSSFAISVGGGELIDISSEGKRNFQWGVQMWANVNPAGASNQLHCHPGSLWSGVYYPDPGGADAETGGGELILEDPRYPMAYGQIADLVLKYKDGSAMQSQYAIRPEAGLLVLFPSWLRHSVRPHRGDRDRISIAMNLSLHAAAA